MKSHHIKLLGSALALGLPMLALSADAQDSPQQPAVVAKGTSPDMDAFLTDGKGRTLYTLVGVDDENKVACDAACMHHWRPYVSNGRPLAKMVLPGLLGTIDKNGTQQVTYREKPLYLFQGDSQPGDMKGQGFNGVWYMVSVLGQVEQASTAVAEAGPVQAAVMAQGAEIFASTCAQCHGAQGQGAFGTKLAGFDRLANSTGVVRTVLLGLNSMPALGAVLNDEQVAAVATYVRNSWGNEFGAISPDQVKAAR